MYEVVISDPAERDLYGIFEYIAFHLQSVENAVGQVERLEMQIASLDRMPERYRRYEREPLTISGSHECAIKMHIP